MWNFFRSNCLNKVRILFLLSVIFSSINLYAQNLNSILTNSGHHYNSYQFPNYYEGKDNTYAYYLLDNGYKLFFLVADKNGKCSDWINLSIALTDDMQGAKPLPVDYVFFNRRAYIFYKAFSHSANAWKLFASEFPKDGNIIAQNSIELARENETGSPLIPQNFDPKILLNQDSTELLIISNTMKIAVNFDNDIYLKTSHAIIFNSAFEKIKEAEINVSSLNKRLPVLHQAIFNNNKLICLIESKIIEKESLQHYDVLTYDFENGTTKNIEIPGEKRIEIDYYPDENNFIYENGVLYIFGQAVSKENFVGNRPRYLEELAFIKIDIATGVCKMKYIQGTSIKKFPDESFLVLDVSLCSDNSVKIYNRFIGKDYRNDTIECIKIDENQNIISRKKTGIRTGFPNFDNTGYVFFGLRKIYLYTVPDKEYNTESKSSLIDLVQISFNEDGSMATEIIFQYEKSDIKPSYKSLGLVDDSNLLLEFIDGHEAKFLKIRI